MRTSCECRLRVESLPDYLGVNKSQAAQILGVHRCTIYDYLDGVMNFLDPHQRPEQWDWTGERRNEALSKNALRILLVLKELNDSSNDRIFSIENLKNRTGEYFDGLRKEI